MAEVHVLEGAFTGASHPDEGDDSPSDVGECCDPSTSLRDEVLIDPEHGTCQEGEASVEVHESSEVVDEGSHPPFVEVVQALGAKPGEDAQEESHSVEAEMAPDDQGDSGIEPPPVSLENGFVRSVLVNFLLEEELVIDEGEDAVDHGEEPEHEVRGDVVSLVWQLTILNCWVAFKTVGRVRTLHQLKGHFLKN